MERDEIHDLSAAYALDALEPQEAAVFEEHLRHCASCREQVAQLREPVAALAHEAPPATPPAELRERILTSARRERGAVVPLRPRWAFPALAAAAVASCVALGLGIWAASLHRTLDRRDALAALLADPAAQRIALHGRPGTLVVGADGRAALVAALGPPPAGKTYELWVIDGGKPARAGVFSVPRAVLVGRPVRRGETVAVTVERAGGVDAPTTKPLLSATA